MNNRTNKELKKIDQLPKYRPKDCWSCDQNHEKSINSLCDFHIKYSYERISREERQDLKNRNKGRIILGIFAVLLFSNLVLILTISELENFAVLFGQSLGYLPWVIWFIWRNEKDTQKWLADHKKDKAEWIRN